MRRFYCLILVLWVVATITDCTRHHHDHNVPSVIPECDRERGPHTDQPPCKDLEPDLGFGPIAMGAMAVGSALASYMANKRRGGKPYSPSKGFLKALEGYQRKDIDQLHSADPFGQKGLGLNAEEMAARIGGDVDQAQSEYKSNLSDIETQAARRGAPSQVSGAFYRARQRAAGGLLGRSAESRRRNIVENAMLKREDMYNRLRAEMAAFTGNTGLFNAVQAVKGNQAAAGPEAIAGLLSALSMGGKGGVPSEQAVRRSTQTTWV